MGHYRKEQYKCHTKYAAVNLELISLHILYSSICPWPHEMGWKWAGADFQLKLHVWAKLLKSQFNILLEMGSRAEREHLPKYFSIITVSLH